MELTNIVLITLTMFGACILNKANLDVKIDLIECNGESEKEYFDKLYPSNYKEGDVVKFSLAEVFRIFGGYACSNNKPFTNLRQVTN